MKFKQLFFDFFELGGFQIMSMLVEREEYAAKINTSPLRTCLPRDILIDGTAGYSDATIINELNQLAISDLSDIREANAELHRILEKIKYKTYRNTSELHKARTKWPEYLYGYYVQRLTTTQMGTKIDRIQRARDTVIDAMCDDDYFQGQGHVIIGAINKLVHRSKQNDLLKKLDLTQPLADQVAVRNHLRNAITALDVYYDPEFGRLNNDVKKTMLELEKVNHPPISLTFEPRGNGETWIYSEQWEDGYIYTLWIDGQAIATADYPSFVVEDSTYKAARRIRITFAFRGLDGGPRKTTTEKKENDKVKISASPLHGNYDYVLYINGRRTTHVSNTPKFNITAAGLDDEYEIHAELNTTRALSNLITANESGVVTAATTLITEKGEQRNIDFCYFYRKLHLTMKYLQAAYPAIANKLDKYYTRSWGRTNGEALWELAALLGSYRESKSDYMLTERILNNIDSEAKLVDKRTVYALFGRKFLSDPTNIQKINLLIDEIGEQQYHSAEFYF